MFFLSSLFSGYIRLDAVRVSVLLAVYGLIEIGLFSYFSLKKLDLYFLCLGLFSPAAGLLTFFLLLGLNVESWRELWESRWYLCGLAMAAVFLGAGKLFFIMKRRVLEHLEYMTGHSERPSGVSAPVRVRVKAGAQVREWLLGRDELSKGEAETFLAEDQDNKHYNAESAADEDPEDNAVCARTESAQPWFLSAVMVPGLLLGALFLLIISLLYLFENFRSDGLLWVLGFCGLGLCALGFWVGRARSFLVRQAGLVLIIVGLILAFCRIVSYDWRSLSVFRTVSRYWSEDAATLFFGVLTFWGCLNLADWPRRTGRQARSACSLRRLTPDKPGSAEEGALFFFLAAGLLVWLLADRAGGGLLWHLIDRAYGIKDLSCGIAAGLLAASAVSAWAQTGPKGVRLAIGIILAGLSWVFAPLGLGLTMFLYARRCGRRELAAGALVYLGAAGILYCTQRDVSLASKAAFLFSLSGLSFLGLVINRRRSANGPLKTGIETETEALIENSVDSPKSEPIDGLTASESGFFRRLGLRRLIILGIMVIVLLAFNAAVFFKERIADRGGSMILSPEQDTLQVPEQVPD
jgi:hypothetical protein